MHIHTHTHTRARGSAKAPTFTRGTTGVKTSASSWGCYNWAFSSVYGFLRITKIQKKKKRKERYRLKIFFSFVQVAGSQTSSIIFFVLNAELWENFPAAVVSRRHQGSTGHINTGSTNLSECGRTSKEKKKRTNICRDRRYNFTSHPSSAFLLFFAQYLQTMLTRGTETSYFLDILH